jgi:hypothetical protein
MKSTCIDIDQRFSAKISKPSKPRSPIRSTRADGPENVPIKRTLVDNRPACGRNFTDKLKGDPTRAVFVKRPRLGPGYIPRFKWYRHSNSRRIGEQRGNLKNLVRISENFS